MNILSFDVEEWYIEKFFKGDSAERYRAYDEVLSRILDLLDEHSTKATFFCLGGLAEYFPQVVKRISERGHEIGCHSNHHRWINKMTPEEFLKDTSEAVRALQDCTGEKVRSYRAPAFSIGNSNKWAFEVLHECGIENDASIFPGARDFGGFPSFEGGGHPCRIKYNGIELNEFPISIGKLPIVNRPIAYSGGGYFRILPLGFVESQIRKSDYTMCYFHVLDLLEIKSTFMTKKEYEDYFKEPGTFKNRLVRYIKSNIGRGRTCNGLSRLLRDFKFFDIATASGGSSSFPMVRL